MIKRDNGEPIGLVDLFVMLLCVLAIIISIVNRQPKQDCPNIPMIIEVKNEISE